MQPNMWDEEPTTKGKAAKPDKRIAYRWTESGAEWALTAAGHYLVLRCGDLVSGVRVHPTIPGLTHRQGTVLSLMAGCGPSPVPVIVVVQWDAPSSRKNVQNPECPVRRYRPDQLEVLRS
jgi:hypothetical protein